MSSSDLAIRVEGLSKSYTIRHNRTDHVTLAEVALDRIKHPLRRAEREEFWALQDVNFEVKQGEVLGLIGRNGAGKSTLLKVLSRITAPTAGRMDLWGRVGSLLEVGTGFHPELTGRENVYLNGSILGMNRREIDRQFDAIVDFAGVEKFLDTPVKRYSSGMYVRLAFAVAAHLETEILLVDEVLAVGDQEFQKRCLGKMRDVAIGGRTVIFVSHQMSSIRALCDRGLGLDGGRVDFEGAADDAVRWINQRVEDRSTLQPAHARPGSGHIRLRSASVADPVEGGDPIRVTLDIDAGTVRADAYFVVLTLRDASRVAIVECDSRSFLTWFTPDVGRQVVFELKGLLLKPGDYTLDVMINSAGVVDLAEPAAEFTVLDGSPYPLSVDGAGLNGALFAPFEIEVLDRSPAGRDGAP